MKAPLKLLIAEDSESDLELLLLELKQAGLQYEWEHITSEAEYLTGLANEPDLILADYQMPQFGALRALELLQAHDLDIPFIVVTGAVTEEKVVEVMRRGADDYLLKDRMVRLGAAIERALEEKRLRTEKQVAEDALHASQRLLASVISSAPVILFAFDTEGRVTLAEGKALAALAVNRDEIVGSSLFAVTGCKPLHEIARRALRGESYSATVTLLEQIWEIRCLPQYGAAGIITGATGVAIDVTEREKARLAEADWTQRFRAIFDDALDAIIITEVNSGTILQSNAATKRLLHYSQEDLDGKSFSMLFGPEVPFTQQELIHSIRKHGAVFESQYFMRSDETVCPMDMTATMIPWGSGEAMLVTLRDVTEREETAEAMLNTELLRVRLEKELELLNLKESFISTVSHEFRTPLTVIMSSSDMLERYHERLSDERRAQHLQKIRLQCNYMTNLLEDVLTFSRAQAGKLEYKAEAVDLENFAEDMLSQIQTISTDRHRFDYQYRGENTVQMDPRLLQHILINLLSNAVKYSPEGGTVRLIVEVDAERAKITISDEGIGIPKSARDRLFDAFYRAGNTNGVSGTGLGLAIVKSSVDIHGGHIDFESTEGVGTSFYVTLPTRKLH